MGFLHRDYFVAVNNAAHHGSRWSVAVMRREGLDDGVGSLAVIGALPRDAVWDEESVHPSRSNCKMLAGQWFISIAILGGCKNINIGVPYV